MPCQVSTEESPLKRTEKAVLSCSYDTFPTVHSSEDESELDCSDSRRFIGRHWNGIPWIQNGDPSLLSFPATLRKGGCRAQHVSSFMLGWCSVSFIILLFAFLISYHYPLFPSADFRNVAYKDEAVDNVPLNKIYDKSEWQWDHNVYQSRPQGEMWLDPLSTDVSWSAEAPGLSPTKRNLLIAQLVGGGGGRTVRNQRKSSYSSSSLWEPKRQWRQLYHSVADITSRPNRAYARQWGWNYVRFQWLWDDDFTMATALFLKVIRDQQREESWSEEEDNDDKGIVTYDAVALLFPGAVIMDLDYNLLELIPSDKLLAVANAITLRTNNDTISTNETHFSGIVLINLQHDRANELIDRWWDDELERSYFPHSNNDVASDDAIIHRLLRMTKSLLLDGEDFSSLVFYLDETDQGFVLEAPYLIPRDSSTDTPTTTEDSSNSFCIKGFSSLTGDSQRENTDINALQFLTDPQLTLATLQTTADAVCYRYYPKCELL